MDKYILQKIKNYLYHYNELDKKIDILKSNMSNYEYNQSYGRYIKNRSSSLEDEVIRKINLENRILKIQKWQELISEILQEYRTKKEIYYDFIVMKYINKESKFNIQKRLGLSLSTQKDMNAKVLHHIFLVAIEKNILKEVC